MVSRRLLIRKPVRKSADVDIKYARQSGGKGQYGHVKIKLDPRTRIRVMSLSTQSLAVLIPKEYIPAVDQGIQGAMLSPVFWQATT